MKKQIATLLRKLANKLYREPVFLPNMTAYGIPVQMAKIRSNYALPANTNGKDLDKFKEYCAQDLKERVAESLHLVKEGGALCADLIILQPLAEKREVKHFIPHT